MKLFELADDPETYGEQAGWWLVVSDDAENELSNPFPTEEMAQIHLGLLQALEDIYNWWTTTPGFQDGEDDMPAALFDGMRDALAKARGQQ